ncbi:MAG: 4a-hydroxytetrahydrobiopterin dehydratase [Nocardioides sp.]|nr:4a-hydroxytetrahydrobiopterin dehydratase [Nocardioides sp.]
MTQQDVDLARQISGIAAAHHLVAAPGQVSELELGLETPGSATIAPVWAALLTGSAESQGRGSPSDEVRDATDRVPNLWFDEPSEAGSQQRFHVEVYLAAEVAGERIAAAVAAGGTVVDDSGAPALTVVADQDGNRGVVCVDVSAATDG